MASPQKEHGYTAIANEIMEALTKIRIAGEARQVLDTIIRKTYGFNKRDDKISTSQFTELTGLPNFTIHKSRKKLLDMNLITVTKKGKGQILTYSFQKDYHKWIPLPKKVTVTKKGNDCNQKRSQSVAQKAIHNSSKVDYTKVNIDCKLDLYSILKDTGLKETNSLITLFCSGLRSRSRCYDPAKCQEWLKGLVASAKQHKPDNFYGYLQASIKNFHEGKGYKK